MNRSNFVQQESSEKINELQSIYNAIDRVQAIMEFELNGNIIMANKNFLDMTGYSMEEIQGKHHSIFCDVDYSLSPNYKLFWRKLNEGEFQSCEYRRIGKDGREIWIQASYNPVFNEEGFIYKVVKFATDITVQKNKNAESKGRLNAIYRNQTVVEFGLDGIILDANDKFLELFGYQLEEIRGQHYSIFCDFEDISSTEHKVFWEKLKYGKFQSHKYKRVDSSGNNIFIQASYNPILSASGEPYKIIMFTTEIIACNKKTENEEQIYKLNEDKYSQAS